MKFINLIVCLSLILLISCKKENDDSLEVNCTDIDEIEALTERGDCNETLGYTSIYTESEKDEIRTIVSNSIPNHAVGLFGNDVGALNPNKITPQNEVYTISINPEKTNKKTYLLNENTGPEYAFGVLMNGVLLDPEAAEPWPHSSRLASNTNWEWNLDAMSINLGLDCNNAHVQPNGKYHYHGAPDLYLHELDAYNNKMTLLGYAADGFPIYFNFGFSDPFDSTSTVVELKSSYQLKSGERPGDGDKAPCGPYSGIYTSDYEYIAGLGDLDECNGRNGITPQYPTGTYYYVLTLNEFPFIPRCFWGIPSTTFKIGA